ncbi:MAG: adenylosuccinate synthase [Dehalococcoidia bacterium]|nr:adenylosuccinate synthase [Dehalococcoidia bacterium]
MPATVVIGGQWGDEGKGRVVDFFARDCSVIARYSAGSNAGHTIVNERGRFALHLVPAGIFYGQKICIIGNGMVIHPQALVNEITMLEERGVDTSQLLVSNRAHVVMPWHPVIDRLDEQLRGEHAIGTTGTGTGPAFVDKVGRLGIRTIDLVTPEALEQKLRFVLDYKNAVITKLYGGEPLRYEAVRDECRTFGELLRPYIADTAAVVQDAEERGEQLLLEGAQGALLDLDSGTYPYVTSSVPASIAAGACIGVGLGPRAVARVVGVYKAYQTRVGHGPMPTELFDADGDALREHGRAQGTGEYGTTTGRPRRCGWFDGVLARYTARLNGVSSVVLTRLDVLAQFDRVKICTGYELGGQRVDTLPGALTEMTALEPIYEELPGWREEISHVRTFGDLPPAARRYVQRVEELLGVPVDMISVGPEREQAIVTRDIFGGSL